MTGCGGHMELRLADKGHKPRRDVKDARQWLAIEWKGHMAEVAD